MNLKQASTQQLLDYIKELETRIENMENEYCGWTAADE